MQKSNEDKITKEDLYTCYKTFYHPSNMFMVVTGNVNPKDVIDIIKNNQSKKGFIKLDNIKLKKYNEPDKVLKNEEEIKMDITIPKVMVAYKINLNKFNLELRKIKDYLSIIFDVKFGETSLANERFVEEKIVNGGIGVEGVSTEDYMLMIISGESDNPQKFISEINKEISNLTVSKEELERKKKSYIGTIVALSNDVYLANNKITDVSPLANIKRELWTINLSNNYIKDISPLANLNENSKSPYPYYSINFAKQYGDQ